MDGTTGEALLIASVTWLAVLSPGADFAVVSRNSCLFGRRAGLAAATGIALACWFHVAYAMAGVALVQRVAPGALDVVRIAGAAYRIYVGLATAATRMATVDAAVAARRSLARDVATGVLTNGLNPKTSLFVLSLYSQLIGAQTPLPVQLAWGAFISLSHLAWFATVSVFLSREAVRAAVLRRQRVLRMTIGAVLVGLGVALLLTRLDPAIGTVS
ncbi:LysE family transporter [Methylobacterium ajmalii]|uniref:LysE family transporter n=1 Tax=Methylobacterium ajmalii TaxID=2738439 RepID=A0ABU9ZR57_9HYPH